MDIKIRGIREDNKEWVYGCGAINNNILVLNADLTISKIPCISDTIGRFVELYSDDGIEIYENDIVEIQDKMETKTSYISEVVLGYFGTKVRPHPAHASMGINNWRDLSWYCDYGFGGKHNVTCKIIGDIYNNPELINKEE